MPIEVSWLCKNRVIHIRMWDEVSLTELTYANGQHAELLQSGTPPVYTITDISESTDFPQNIFETRKKLVTEYPQDQPWIIFVGGSPVIRFRLSMIVNMMKGRFVLVDTMDEAIKFINDRDAILTTPHSIIG